MGPKVEETTETSTKKWGARGTAAATIAGCLTFEAVSRYFGADPAVQNFSLNIDPGEIICLLGPSGCGKSTLLRMAAGIDRPTSGRILLNNKELSSNSTFVLPEKRNIGLMFQDFALFPHLTILDNVAFGLKSLGATEAKSEARISLDRVGLLRYAEDYPHILSGGQQQRVALARAIAPRPSVLLMDEPFSGLDSRLRESMREETLAILHETRATCIIVTHQSEEAMRMGDRIVVMKDGQMVQADSAEGLYNQPSDLFVARMFSEINEIECVVKKGAVDTPLGIFSGVTLSDNENAILCVRQNAISLVEPGKGCEGRIVRRKFLGDKVLLEVVINGLDAPLLVQLKQTDMCGDKSEVGVEIDRDSILLFPEAP